jgi:iron(III) transport system substrate-binding protein
VWWSSEALGTIRLAREGLLEARRSAEEARVGGGWPGGLAGPRDAAGAPEWYGFACRIRVIAYDTRDVEPARAPASLQRLTAPQWKGRVGMARPEFGTTRGQMAALASECGPDSLRSWLVAMRANGLRLYDGNSAVVRAIAQGEIDIGLTDNDDVAAAQREGWPVGSVLEVADDPGTAGTGLCSRGPMLLPNTVALVKGAPHAEAAGALIDFLLGAEVEHLLEESESHNLSVLGATAPEAAGYDVPAWWLPDLAAADKHADEALRICAEILGSP